MDMSGHAPQCPPTSLRTFHFQVPASHHTREDFKQCPMKKNLWPNPYDCPENTPHQELQKSQFPKKRGNGRGC